MKIRNKIDEFLRFLFSKEKTHRIFSIPISQCQGNWESTSAAEDLSLSLSLHRKLLFFFTSLRSATGVHFLSIQQCFQCRQLRKKQHQQPRASFNGFLRLVPSPKWPCAGLHRRRRPVPGGGERSQRRQGPEVPVVLFPVKACCTMLWCERKTPCIVTLHQIGSVVGYDESVPRFV